MCTRIIFFLSIVFVMTACNSQDEEGIPIEERETELHELNKGIKYAKGFNVENRGDFKVITINSAWRGINDSYQYVLYKNEKPSGFENATFIQVPIEKIVCMSATHIALLDKLGELKSIVAMSGQSYVSNPTVQEMIKTGEIMEVGNYQALNYEMLIDKQPDLIMLFGVNESSNRHINKLKELELNVVLNAEYMETHPLGRLEWIKFVAAFYEIEEKADSIFNIIERDYLELAQLTKQVKNKPTVFTGMPWNGVWNVPGGASFVAKLLDDAGANYLWSENNEIGSYPKDTEIILDEALNADYWINQNSFSDKQSIANFDQKFKSFLAFKEGKLYNNDNRINDKGGNDYWESGVVNPDLILKDLIEIFHPQILEHELYYYKKLK